MLVHLSNSSCLKRSRLREIARYEKQISRDASNPDFPLTVYLSVLRALALFPPKKAVFPWVLVGKRGRRASPRFTHALWRYLIGKNNDQKRKRKRKTLLATGPTIFSLLSSLVALGEMRRPRKRDILSFVRSYLLLA
jgi:hypothetical protein